MWEKEAPFSDVFDSLYRAPRTKPQSAWYWRTLRGRANEAPKHHTRFKTQALLRTKRKYKDMKSMYASQKYVNVILILLIRLQRPNPISYPAPFFPGWIVSWRHWTHLQELLTTLLFLLSADSLSLAVVVYPRNPSVTRHYWKTAWKQIFKLLYKSLI